MTDVLATTRKRKVNEIEGQPKPGMTVQEYLLEEKTKMIEAIQEHIRVQVNKLKNEFELGKFELENVVEQTITKMEKDGDQENNKQSSKKSKTSASSSSSNSSRKNSITKKIKIVVIEGVHKDASFNFKRTQRLIVMVGRSTGKRFKKGGVSLFKDSEVSTTHGKFHIVKDDLCFSDLGSTNGSFLNGEALEVR